MKQPVNRSRGHTTDYIEGKRKQVLKVAMPVLEDKDLALYIESETIPLPHLDIWGCSVNLETTPDSPRKRRYIITTERSTLLFMPRIQINPKGRPRVRGEKGCYKKLRTSRKITHGDTERKTGRAAWIITRPRGQQEIIISFVYQNTCKGSEVRRVDYVIRFQKSKEK